MKAVMLSTSSNETTKYAHSLESVIGSPVEIIRYDTGHAHESTLYEQVVAAKPEFVLYIGSAWGVMPSTTMLAKINHHIAPMVHLCSDAADPPWWPLLREYSEKGCFTLQVSIDGNPTWPGASRGLTLLTPVDPTNFSSDDQADHFHRGIACGYAGNPGGPGGRRREVLTACWMKNAITVRMRDDGTDSYSQYCDFLMGCRMSLNIPYTGTETSMHVKGRVIESGLAGCCVLEVAGSPTSLWFTPNEDYIEYASLDQLTDQIEQYGRQSDETQRRGENLRKKVLAEHTPEIFWSKVFHRVGLKKAA